MTPTHACCRSCGNDELPLIVSLQRTPLANRLLTADQLEQVEPTYPLDLVFCPECSLVQITETVSPEELFREYLYFSSFSDTALSNAEEIVLRLIARRDLRSTSLAAEIASNDGYLLQHYHTSGIPVLGIEPAANIAKVAQEERGIRTISEFFGVELARELQAAGEQADVIHANNVLAHVADLNGFVAGIKLFLKDDGIVVIEVPYVADMVHGVEFDTIYHEHLCYFSLTALDRLFLRHGLRISDVEHLPIHGGTLRVFAIHDSHASASQRSVAVHEMLANERAHGMDAFAYYRHFGDKVEALRGELLALLQDLKSQGKRIAVYGASAKGSTLLNYFQVGSETLDFVVDRSTAKQGRYTPGTHLLISSPERLLEEMPDYVLLLTWNFADEILGQQTRYRERGGRFIIPIPELRVV
ncbi:MAG: class I SAM-dependent methyltransferase [Herpetosiphon sp.]